MKKILFVSVNLCLSLLTQAQQNARIRGIIKGVGNEKIYLENKPDGISNEFIPIAYDSVYSRNDSFEFNVKFNQIDFYSIQYSCYGGWLSFVIDTGTIIINAVKDLIYKGEVIGSHQNDIYKDYEKSILNPFYKTNRHYFDSADKYRNIDSLKFDYYNTILNTESDNFRNKQKEFIRCNPDSYTALKLVSQNRIIFDRDSLSYYFNLLSPRFQNHSTAIDIKYRINSFTKNVAVGSRVPNFNFSDRNGKSTNLYDIYSKYKIISFWASWCGPCLAELPSLKYINTNYKKYVKIISFSTDTKKDNWVKAMNNHKIYWNSFSDLQGNAGKFARYFSVHEIPLLILLNEKNKIIKYNIDILEVEKILSRNQE